MHHAVWFVGTSLAVAGGIGACVGADPSTTNPPGGDSGTDSGTQTIDDAGSDAGAPTSTYCAGRVAAIGAPALFCADFDEPTAPRGAYVAGSFNPTAFTNNPLRGGVAALQPGSLGTNTTGQKLAVDKPPNSGSTEETGALYVATLTLSDASKGLRVSLDAVMTRTAAVSPLAFLVFYDEARTQAVSYADENAGTTSVVARDTSGLNALSAPGAAGTLWHFDIVLDPNPQNSQYTFSATLNGVAMQESSMTSKVIATALPSVLRLELGGVSEVAGDGSATVHLDNVLVQTLR